jgi:PST family polysaccharide transporter
VQLSHHAFHAFKWSAFGEAASRTIGPLVFLVLARLLVPSDFGVVAAATVVISFSQVFSDAGLAKALIQRQDRTDDSANVVFWLNLGLGMVVVGILFAAAPWIADFFHDVRIAPVTRVLSVQILLAAFSSTHTALLQKSLDFKQLFWVRLLTTGLPALASIPLALTGFGYWALVAGSVGGQLVQSIVLWRLSRWRPHWGIDRGLATELIRFGKWAMVSGLLGWFYVWIDAVVVGHYLGAHDMGLYRTGNTLVTTAFGLFFAPMLPVLYSLFSRAHHRKHKVGNSLLIVTRCVALLAFPIAAALFILSVPIEQSLFGSEWKGLGPIIAILAIAQGLAWLVGANGEAYRAIGQPHLETWAMGLSAAVYLIGYLLSVRYGLIAFAMTRCGLVFFGLLTQVLIASHAMKIRPFAWIKITYRPLILITLLLAPLQLFGAESMHESWRALLFLVLALVIYALYLLFYERSFLMTFYGGKRDAR